MRSGLKRYDEIPLLIASKNLGPTGDPICLAQLERDQQVSQLETWERPSEKRLQPCRVLEEPKASFREVEPHSRDFFVGT